MDGRHSISIAVLSENQDDVAAVKAWSETYKGYEKDVFSVYHNKDLGELYWDWGIPTAASVAQLAGLDFGIIATGGVLAVLPPLLLVVIFQRYLMTGLVGGAVKG